MFVLRRFEFGDREAVQKLINQIMDGEFREEKSAFPADDLESIGETYGRLGEAFFVAEEGEKIVGTVGVKRENDRVALLRRLFVSPENRKRKIGLGLLNRAIEFCEEVGYRELVFKTTSRMTEAIALLKKRGFHSRAKVPMGKLELVKLSLSLRERH